MDLHRFFFVRLAVEEILKRGQKEEAHRAAFVLVDAWAKDVIAAHIGSARFPLQAKMVLAAAAHPPYHRRLGMGRNQTPEVLEWVLKCNALFNDRVRFWADIAARFKKVVPNIDQRSFGS